MQSTCKKIEGQSLKWKWVSYNMWYMWKEIYQKNDLLANVWLVIRIGKAWVGNRLEVKRGIRLI